MKKSLQLLLVLAIVFFITDRLICMCLKEIDKKVFTGQSVGKVNHFFSLKDSVNLLVFGSSRANHHIDNGALGITSFNMGADGTKIGYSAALISTLKKKDQILLVHIDHASLYNAEYNGSDMLGLKNMIQRDDDVSNFIYNYFPEEIYISRIFSSYIYNGKVLGILKNFVAPNYNYKVYNGYDPLYPNQEQREVFEKLLKSANLKLVPDDMEVKELEINPVIDKFIDAIMDYSKKNNSRLIFFTSPTLKKIHINVRSRTKQYFESKNTSYHDYSGFFEKYNADYWKDFTHMSAHGATAFTKAFKEEVLK
mgnify:CR=1 FL=1|tara:strand:- start:837 stop:1763 length:927 start_codon:yes stop_codon:yes gene_type:complete